MKESFNISLLISIGFLITSCQWNLETLSPNNKGFRCGDVWIDTRDNQEYLTVQIGTQCWFAKNINIGTRINLGITQTENGTIEKYCQDDEEGKCETYGGLYQIREALQTITRHPVTGDIAIPGDTFMVQGICPDGWHIPSDEEWKTLEIALGLPLDSVEIAWKFRGGSIQLGNKLKSLTEDRCTSPDDNCGASGFDGLMGGLSYVLNNNGPMLSGGDGTQAFWWSSTPERKEDEGSFYRRELAHDEQGVMRASGNINNGYAVRCIKDK